MDKEKVFIDNQISNSKNFREVCLPNLFQMQQYESIADFITQEPLSMRLKIREDEEFFVFEQVFRTRIWVTNQKSEAWLIFSEDREWKYNKENIGGLVIRNVVWDRHSDFVKIKNRSGIGVERDYNEWPSIKSRNIYLNPDIAVTLIKQILLQMDKVLERGIIMTKRKSGSGFCWSDVEVMRLFNWGQVKATWNPCVESENIEEFIFGFGELMEKYFINDVEANEVNQMELNYSCLPNVMKDIIQGSTYTR